MFANMVLYERKTLWPSIEKMQMTSKPIYENPHAVIIPSISFYLIAPFNETCRFLNAAPFKTTCRN